MARSQETGAWESGPLPPGSPPQAGEGEAIGELRVLAVYGCGETVSGARFSVYWRCTGRHRTFGGPGLTRRERRGDWVRLVKNGGSGSREGSGRLLASDEGIEDKSLHGRPIWTRLEVSTL